MDNKEQYTPTRFLRWSIVLAGIILGQVFLYGSCLIGQKVLLPLDILAKPNVYIPSSPTSSPGGDATLIDLVTQFEPERRFAVSELHSGRFPLWDPYHYGGAPFVWPKYSIFLLLECCTASPVILAWVQLLAAVIGGVGMYLFCRRSLEVGFWPAAVCAWCYPLTAFFILWQGYPEGLPVYWLPWIFLAIDRTLRTGNPLAATGLASITFLVLTSGNTDIGGQVLLGAGLYAAWLLGNAIRNKEPIRKLGTATMMLVFALGLGFLLAAPHILPLVEYAQSGSRMLHRSGGFEERPPAGLVALPQVVLPEFYGTYARNSMYIIPSDVPTNLVESTAACYTGALATFVIAPLAWCHRRRWAINGFWVVLAFFGLSWCLNIPGLVSLLRLHGLNMMSHNRLVFLTSFAILSLTAIGLENLLKGFVSRRWWFLVPAGILAGLYAWCFYRGLFLPEPVGTQLEPYITQGKRVDWIKDLNDVHQVQAWFIRHYTIMALICAVGVVGWLVLWFRRSGTIRLFPLAAIFLTGELLWFDYGCRSAYDPALYYPSIPVLNEVAQSVPGRIIGQHCLPACLASMAGLNDIRGYDAIDPKRMVELLKTAVQPGGGGPYAVTQWAAPEGGIRPPNVIELKPVMDMLDVRYVIFRGTPPIGVEPVFRGNDYWALVNSNAFRVFVPASVETVTDDTERLKKLASEEFKPREVAYVEAPVELPAVCRGTVSLVHDSPMDVKISARMETPGLIVLADNWDKGWRAFWNGRSVPVLRTNHALRGVVVPAGTGTLEFVYRPASLILGLWLAGFAALILLGWVIVCGWTMKREAGRQKAAL
jgi:hypothetical protein